LLGRLPGDGVAGEEVDDAAGALARIDIAGQISVAVPDQLRLLFSLPGVVESITPCACNIPQHMLHASEMIFTRVFHEPAQIPTEKVRSGRVWSR